MAIHPQTTPRQLSAYLRGIETHAGFLARLKIGFRPYICPFHELLEFIGDGATVFDIGCGSGQFCLLAAHFRRPAAVAGVEVSPALVQNARELFANASPSTLHGFELYGGDRLPSAAAGADLLFLIDVLHHVPEKRQAYFLQEVHRAMKAGARLVVKDIDAGSALVACNKLHDLVFAREIGHEIALPDLVRMAQDAGFLVRSQSRHTMWLYPHYTVVLEKAG